MSVNKIPTLDSTSKLKSTGSYTGEQVIVKNVGMFELVYDNSVPNNYSIFKAPNGGTWNLILAAGEVTPLTPLAAPVLAATSDGEDTIEVLIASVVGAENYIIEVSEDGVSDWIEIYNMPIAGLFIHGYLNPSSQKFYRGYVTAEGSANSPYATDDATTDAPVVPTQLDTPSLSAVAAGSDTINVTIGTVADAEVYIIRKSANGVSGWVEVYNEAVAGVFNDTGLNPLEQWFYDAYVTAVGFIDSDHATDDATTTDVASLITANRFVDYDFLEGTGQRAFNAVGGNTSNNNIIGMSEQYFLNQSSFWVAPYLKTPQETVTANYAANVNGINQAHRITTGTDNTTYGTPAGYRIQGVSYPAGQYTMSLAVKSNTGSAQVMRMGYDNGATMSADLNVTTGWTRVSFTFTHAGGAKLLHFIANGAANAALDILFDQLKLETGAVATAYTTPKLDFTFGNDCNTEAIDPTWVASKGIALSGSQFGIAISDTTITPTNISIYVVGKAATGGTTQNYPIATQFNDNGFQMRWGVGGTADSVVLAAFKFSNSAVVPVQTLKLNDNSVHVVAGTYDGANLKIYVDGILFGTLAATGLSSTSIKRLLLSDTDQVGGRYFNGEIYKIVGFTDGHDATQVLQETQALSALMTSRGITMAANDTFVATEGDSISNVVSGGTWPRKCMRLYTTNVLSENFAKVGATMIAGVNSIQNRSALIDSYYNAGRTNNILTVFVGANDCAAPSGFVASTFVATLKAYCQARQAVGWKVVLCTILPNTTNSAVANRNAANPLIRADSSFYDALADIAADATMGGDTACLNATYYPDGVHPSDAGHAILAPIIKAAIDSIIV